MQATTNAAPSCLAPAPNQVEESGTNNGVGVATSSSVLQFLRGFLGGSMGRRLRMSFSLWTRNLDFDFLPSPTRSAYVGWRPSLVLVWLETVALLALESEDTFYSSLAPEDSGV